MKDHEDHQTHICKYKQRAICGLGAIGNCYYLAIAVAAANAAASDLRGTLVLLSMLETSTFAAFESFDFRTVRLLACGVVVFDELQGLCGGQLKEGPAAESNRLIPQTASARVPTRPSAASCF